MCGLAGIISHNKNSSREFRLNIVRNMINEIEYRGPDDEQFFVNDKVALLFRRLSIIDIKNGSQPIYNEDKSIIIAVNGEIYNSKELIRQLRSNHTFRSSSDCEVLVHLYEEKGIAFLDDLVGMYSIALYDQNENKFFLARDRFGIKPLFYHNSPEELVFGSEIKSLLKHPKCPKEFNWREALTDPWISGAGSSHLSGASTFFKGIHQVQAGSFIEVNLFNNELNEVRYWCLEEILRSGSDRAHDKKYWIEGYHALLEDSVQKCLQSDVQVGSFLSGGIDSVAVTALASTHKNIPTFTVLSPSTYANEDAKYAHMISKEMGLTNHQVLFRQDDYSIIEPDTYKKLLWVCETPYCGPEQVYKFHLHKFAKKLYPNLKVILTGQGSDEFNGGYSTILSPAYENDWKGFLSSLDMMDENRIYRNSDTSNLRVWEENLGISPIAKSFLKEVSNDKFKGSPLDSYLLTKYRDLQMYNCWHEDRVAAVNNIENRVPFLDHRIVEFLAKIPEELKSELLWDKQILRKGLVSKVRDAYRFREKVPFFYGKDVKSTHRMMYNLLKANDYQLLSESLSRSTDILNPDHLYSIFSSMDDDPSLMNFEFLLRIVNMGLLSSMAAENTQSFQRESIVLSSLEIEDWSSEERLIATELGIKQIKIIEEDVFELSPGIEIIKSNDQKMYILNNEQVEFILLREDVGLWFEFLLKVNGENTMSEILNTLGLGREDIEDHLLEALEYNIICVKEALLERNL
ncbi:asparagine synthase (glutamine-hydrolyzing) [Halobacillus trueperi]|uniref:asparagine synthase (glutamine-hydrolyzing) n=1 Tax=Halobacillus trueperi TaxID=156205 RepID=A0A3E0J500_9BACI|nr:asparagine synthase (glutamine-hydrolyzing) [Halobacillus trueperi]REJ07941.1 asparagine synthase (glutamine-hydrolyzing) [Halobacillus trueperi]